VTVPTTSFSERTLTFGFGFGSWQNLEFRFDSFLLGLGSLPSLVNKTALTTPSTPHN